jgi:hypothetical protein
MPVLASWTTHLVDYNPEAWRVRCPQDRVNKRTSADTGGFLASYRQKRLHNYHELGRGERWRYLLIDRPRLDDEQRFFFEGCRALSGQTYIADRRALHDAVLSVRPTCCFEVGTFTGGGSTLFLSTALFKLGRGRLVTLEADAGFHRGAVAAYRRWLPHLVPFVDFIHGNDLQVFEPYLLGADAPRCVFLDGSDDLWATLEQFRFFDGHSRPGDILMAHDWNTEKMHLLRPLLEAAGGWRRRLLLVEPESVGFAAFECIA